MTTWVRPRESRAWAAGVCAAAALLGGCSTASGDPAAGPTPAPSTTTAPPADSTAADPALEASRALLAAFTPDFEGFAPASGGTPRIASARDLMPQDDELTPPACRANFHADRLMTPDDLGTAGDDPVALAAYTPSGALPAAGEPDIPVIDLAMRIFATTEDAATMMSDLLDADCEGYEVRNTRTRVTGEFHDATVTPLELDGVDGAVAQISFGSAVDRIPGADGEVEERTFSGWSSYLHVAGPYAIVVRPLYFEDEEAARAIAAQAIRSFVDHMRTSEL